MAVLMVSKVITQSHSPTEPVTDLTLNKHLIANDESIYSYQHNTIVLDQAASGCIHIYIIRLLPVMSNKTSTVLCVGELLWDCFPD